MARPLAVESVDGLSWTRSTGWPDIETIPGSLIDVESAGQALVAVGPGGSPVQPYAWFSGSAE